MMVKILSKAFFVVKVISFLGLFCLTILFVGCTKTENKTVYESTEVKGNKAPNNGVTSSQITAYIDRSYIDLIGQEASSTELSQNLLQDSKISPINVFKAFALSTEYNYC
jgi:uncharacterized membrane protein